MPPLVAWHRHHQGLGHGRVIHQPLFYGLGLDVLPSRDEEVVEPPSTTRSPPGEAALVPGVEPALFIEGRTSSPSLK